MSPSSPLDLAPARWVWLDATVAPASSVLFRRTFELSAIPATAGGWILVPTRYRLSVNGRRVQSGPALSDPRHPEADPVDLRPFLKKGRNTIGLHVVAPEQAITGDAEVLAHLSAGDLALHTGSRWEAHANEAHTFSPGSSPGESFDSRRFPHGWDDPDRLGKGDWSPVRESDLSATERPPLHGNPPQNRWVLRSTPLMREEVVRARALVERGDWSRDRSAVPPSNRERVDLSDESRIALSDNGDRFLLFELPYQMMGRPQITFDAPKGTVLEVSGLLSATEWGTDSKPHFRWVSRGVEETFESFDFLRLRFLLLRLIGAEAGTQVRRVGVRKRESDFPIQPVLATDDPELSRLFKVSLQAIKNSVQDHLCDGSPEEARRQSGEGMPSLAPARTFFGGTAASARFLRTFAHGQLDNGTWPEAWPNLDASETGGLPNVERSLAFVREHVAHAEHTGDLAIVRENWPRLERFFAYLRQCTGEDGLFAVEWLPDESRCAFNLDIRATVARAITIAPEPGPLHEWESRLANALRAAYYRDALGTYVANASAYDAGGSPRFDERSLIRHLLNVERNQAPEALRLLTELPPQVERSRPENADLRVVALAHHGRIDAVLEDLRRRSADDESSIRRSPASSPAVLLAVHRGLVGIAATAPGYVSYDVRPNFDAAGETLNRLETIVAIPTGALRFSAERENDVWRYEIVSPRYGRGSLHLRDGRIALIAGTRENFRELAC